MPLDDTHWLAPSGRSSGEAGPTTTKTDATTELLIRARSFIERGWCRYMLAVDADAHPVDPTTTDAVAWCAEGALYAAGMCEVLDYHPARSRLKAATGGIHTTLFNDGQETVAPVLAAFDRAIFGVQL